MTDNPLRAAGMARHRGPAASRCALFTLWRFGMVDRSGSRAVRLAWLPLHARGRP